MTLGGVALCAVPWLGALAGIIGGITMLSANRREKTWALLHTGEVPLRRIEELAAGQRVRLQGRVISKPTVTAPVSERPVVYAAVTGTSSSSYEKGVNERKLALRSFGDSIEIEDGSGSAELQLKNVHILSRHVHQHDEHNQGHLPALRDVCYKVPAGWYLDVEEMSIEPGDELWMVGRIEAVEDVPAERPEGYRASGARKRVVVGGGADEDVRITNVTPEELGRVLAMSPGFTVMGVIWLVAAIASLAFWGYRFSR